MMAMTTSQEMQIIPDIINLVSDEESSDVIVDDSSDEVEIISDSETSTHSSNEPPEIPQLTVPSYMGVSNGVQPVRGNTFIEELVKVVSVKQEPIAYAYESVPDGGGCVQVKSEVDSYDPVTQKRVGNVTAANNPITNGYESVPNCGGLVQVKSEVDSHNPHTQQEEFGDASHQGIAAVIAKLGSVNGNIKNEQQAVSGPRVFLSKNIFDKSSMSRDSQDEELHLHVKEKSLDTAKELEQVPKTPIFCNVCGRTFYENSALQKHMDGHFVDCKEKCNLCGKRFRNKVRLSYHMLSHTGERPFRCELCGAGFKIMYHLQYHMFSHTNERPHVCETCGKRYKQFCHLKQHRKKHNEFFMLKCPECDKIFYGAGTLKSHRYKHTGEWPFKCQICLKGFSNLKWCEIHEAKHLKSEIYPEFNLPASESCNFRSLVKSPSEMHLQTAPVSDTPILAVPSELDTSPCELEVKTEQIPEYSPVTGEQSFPFNRFSVT